MSLVSFCLASNSSSQRIRREMIEGLTPPNALPLNTPAALRSRPGKFKALAVCSTGASTTGASSTETSSTVLQLHWCRGVRLVRLRLEGSDKTSSLFLEERDEETETV